MIRLSDCVKQVESSGNYLAMRFEPTYTPTPSSQQAVQKYASGGYMDMTTARMICQTSWGAFQIMGANLYGNLDCQTTLATYLQNSANIQLSMFNRFIQQIGFSDGPYKLMSQKARLRFARLYNGSEVYAHSLDEAYDNLEKTI